MFIKSSFLVKILFSPAHFFALLRTLSFRDKIFASTLILTALASIVWWGIALRNHLTITMPQRGGIYTEGFVGQPGPINPLITTADAGADLTHIIYESLFTYDHTGTLVPQLAQEYTISEDLKTYTITLKEGVMWQDGLPLEAADVVFTADRIRNVSFAIPLRLQWTNVSGVRKTDDRTIIFELTEPSATFLQNLTVGILPQHLWSTIGPEQFQITELNRKPIGTGPYTVTNFTADDSGNVLVYTLDAFDGYHDTPPFIETIEIKFYQQNDVLVSAFNQKKVDGAGFRLSELIDKLSGKAFTIHAATLPEYSAVFFNKTKSVPLSFAEVRRALALATDRDAIIAELFNGRAQKIRSPLLTTMPGFTQEYMQPEFDQDEANSILEKAGWKRGDDGVRSKDGTRLAFTMHTIGSLDRFTQTTELLTRQWAAIGVQVQVQTHDFNQFDTNILKTRNYEAILFGHRITASPDLFALWQSEQTGAGGLNHALFKNSVADTALTELRRRNDPEQRAVQYKIIQEQIAKEVPAIFLYSPSYIYVHNERLQGFTQESPQDDDTRIFNEPHNRFYNITQWYVKTKRVWKK